MKKKKVTVTLVVGDKIIHEVEALPDRKNPEHQITLVLDVAVKKTLHTWERERGREEWG